MDRTFIDRRASESEHRSARDVAQAVVAGRTTVLEAVRALVSLAHTDAIADVEDRRFIIAIESETDHLPVGEVRKLWAPSALKEKDVKISHAEELYRNDFLETCRRISNPNCSVNQRPRLISHGRGIAKVISSRPSMAMFFRKLTISPCFACWS
jgi:hypothetical protein